MIRIVLWWTAVVLLLVEAFGYAPRKADLGWLALALYILGQLL